MRRSVSLIGGAVALSLVVAPSALAQAVPTLPLDSYADTVLAGVLGVLEQIWPYAAVFTCVGIALRAVSKYIGFRRAGVGGDDYDGDQSHRSSFRESSMGWDYMRSGPDRDYRRGRYRAWG